MRKHNGFMTVELLVTLIVGAVLVLSLNSIVVSHSFLSARARSTVVANAFAEQKIEALRSAGFLGVPVSTTFITSDMPADLQKPRSARLEVTSVTSAIKRVHLTVTYNEQGASRTHTYVTYIGELGVGQY